MASRLASTQMTIDDGEAARRIAGQEQDVLGKDRRPEGGDGLAHHEADQPQPHRLLQDHPGDGAVAGADELEHGDLADLAQGQGVDDEGDDGGADHREDDQEHDDLTGRGGDELGLEDLLHLGAGVDLEALPAADLPGHRGPGPRPGSRRTSTALTEGFTVWEARTASSTPGTPGRLKAGLAAVRRRWWTMASLSLRNWASWASLSGMKTMGSPPEETVRRVRPTTV